MRRTTGPIDFINPPLHHTDHSYSHHYDHPHPYHQHQQYHQQGAHSYPRSRIKSYQPQPIASSSYTQLPSLTSQLPSRNNQHPNILPPILNPRFGPTHSSRDHHQSISRKSFHPASFGLEHNRNPYSSSSRIVSSTSRASDLAKYAMSKDEKPVIDSDRVARHRSRSSSMSPRPATVDVEVSRKRKDRDTEDSVLLSPGTPGSNSSFLMTPKFEAKKISMIDHLALKEENTIKDLGPGPLASIEGEEPFPWYKSTYDVSNFPSAGAQNPITVFPVSYQTYQQPNTQNNNTAQQGQTSQGNETPNTLAAQQNNANSVQLDPTLSSIRSSVIPNSNGDQNPLIDPTLSTPEIRFPDAETLASATASPGRDGIPGDASTQAALAAVGGTPTLTAEDAAALLAPPQDSDTPIKKEQPFSRSPELRVSHKLAERKRRKEMKELFDELRDELPSDRGMKASKWEILSKAIDHVRQLKASQEQMVREIDHLRREVDIARGGTGAYTHAYNTYNLTGTYPPQNTFSNTSTPAAQNTAQQSQQQVQQPQQTTQQLAQPQQQIQQQVQPQQQTQQIQQPVQQQQTQQVESTDIQVDPTPVAQ